MHAPQQQECIACRAWRHSRMTICWLAVWALGLSAFVIWSLNG